MSDYHYRYYDGEGILIDEYIYLDVRQNHTLVERACERASKDAVKIVETISSVYAEWDNVLVRDTNGEFRYDD